MEITLLHTPDGNAIARGTYPGGPEYEFVVDADGQVYFQVVDETERVWAGPDDDSFRRIAAAWTRFRGEIRTLRTEAAQLERVARIREELALLGAFPIDLGQYPEPLWSLLVFEAENGLI